jgi:hypothetical protein
MIISQLSLPNTAPRMPGGRSSNPRKRAVIERYEDDVIPAGMARYTIQTATMRIRGHIERYGGSALLSQALAGLDGIDAPIERLCLAYGRLLGYPYNRPRVHA